MYSPRHPFSYLMFWPPRKLLRTQSNSNLASLTYSKPLEQIMNHLGLLYHFIRLEMIATWIEDCPQWQAHLAREQRIDRGCQYLGDRAHRVHSQTTPSHLRPSQKLSRHLWKNQVFVRQSRVQLQSSQKWTQSLGRQNLAESKADPQSEFDPLYRDFWRLVSLKCQSCYHSTISREIRHLRE